MNSAHAPGRRAQVRLNRQYEVRTRGEKGYERAPRGCGASGRCYSPHAVLHRARCRAPQDDSDQNTRDPIRAITTFSRRSSSATALNEVNGNQDTYDTFVNLGSGVRLFDYTLDMRSLNHQGSFLRRSEFQQLRLWRRSERRFAAAHRQEQMVRLPPAVPARQEFLGLQPLRQSAESRATEPGGFADDRLHRQPAYSRASGPSGLLLESVHAARQFGCIARSRAPHAGLRPDALPAIPRAIPPGLFA